MMREKEIAEIRRRYRSDRSNISRICGCFVDSQKTIISEFDQSLGSMTQDDADGMLGVLKKVLSHKIMVTLWMRFVQTDVFVYVETNNVLKRYFAFFMFFHQLFVYANRGASRGKSKCCIGLVYYCLCNT